LREMCEIAHKTSIPFHELKWRESYIGFDTDESGARGGSDRSGER